MIVQTQEYPFSFTLFLYQILTLWKAKSKIETCANNINKVMYLWHDPSFSEVNETLQCAAEICRIPTGMERVQVSLATQSSHLKHSNHIRSEAETSTRHDADNPLIIT